MPEARPDSQAPVVRPPLRLASSNGDPIDQPTEATGAGAGAEERAAGLPGGDRAFGGRPASGLGVGRPRADARSVVDDMIDELSGLPQRVPAEPDVPTVPEPPSDAPADPPQLARIATHLRRPDLPAAEETRPDGFDVKAIIAAVRGVSGVKDAKLRLTEAGAHSLRLDLADGADPAEVSRHVARLLQERMGLAAAPQNLPGMTPMDSPPLGGDTPATGFGRSGGYVPPPPAEPTRRPGDARAADAAPARPDAAPARPAEATPARPADAWPAQAAAPPPGFEPQSDPQAPPAHRGRAQVGAQSGVDTRDLADRATAQRRADEAAAQRRADEATTQRRADEAAAQRRVDEAAGQRRADETANQRRIDGPAASGRVGDATDQRRADETAGQRRVDGTAAAGRVGDLAAQRRADEAAGQSRMDGAAAGGRADDMTAQRRADEAAGLRQSDDTAGQGRVDDAAGQRLGDGPVGLRRSDELTGQGRVDDAAGQRLGDDPVGLRRSNESTGQRRVDDLAGQRRADDGLRRLDETAGQQRADEAATQRAGEAGGLRRVDGATGQRRVDETAGPRRVDETVGQRRSDEAGRERPADEPLEPADDAERGHLYGSTRRAGRQAAADPTQPPPGFPEPGSAAGVIGSLGGHPVMAAATAYSGGQITTTESAPSRPLNPGDNPGPRVVIDHVQVSTFGLDATVETRLAAGKQVANGLATGPAVDGYVLRLCAVSAASAIDELLRNASRADERGRCFVEHAAVVPFGNCEVAVVVVLLVCGGWVEQLAGSALVSGDPRQAVVRATLAAVNRRLEALLSE
ncbi:hypothetical protein [Asanoa siamensis]|uniref:hypothetical protein n=1 Tax=Asanoa siamensis TaxID=926357 RepID=UPI001EF164C5|nr:hypothetical protein [Asanoa siamensis]